jgi:LCP family protein required for cell wall assembly
MAPDEKPYRVYRGGRKKGKVPAITGSGRNRPSRSKTSRSQPGHRLRFNLSSLKRISWKRWVVIGVVTLFALFIVWAVTSYLAFSGGVADANKRLPHSARVQLQHQNGLLLSHATTILLLGTDSAPNVKDRSGDRHSDSIVLVRTDPGHHRLSLLSIPRDLYVPIPGLGSSKINAAYQFGGPALAIKTIREYTGVPINHVVIVNFTAFKDLIDAEGGVTINVPEAILSNRFDCPYKTAARCAKWPGWRFHRGRQHMNGERALIYSRIRENQLNPRENDLTRGARQQAVIEAATSNLTSIGTLLDLPFDGGSLLKPLETDLTAPQILQLGWLKFRSSSGSTLYCRLGGDTGTAGGESVILPSEENRNVLSMWAGDSAPQPPVGTYGPGCIRGHPLQ